MADGLEAGPAVGAVAVVTGNVIGFWLFTDRPHDDHIRDGRW